MTDIEQKALALVNEVEEALGLREKTMQLGDSKMTICLRRAIERHEAFRQEVSDAIVVALLARLTPDHERLVGQIVRDNLARFIIAKPVDPFVEIMAEVNDMNDAKAAEQLREALAKRGGKIVWED